MMYDLILTGKFKKSLKLAKKRGLNIHLLEEVVNILLFGKLNTASSVTLK